MHVQEARHASGSEAGRPSRSPAGANGRAASVAGNTLALLI